MPQPIERQARTLFDFRDGILRLQLTTAHRLNDVAVRLTGAQDEGVVARRAKRLSVRQHAHKAPDTDGSALPIDAGMGDVALGVVVELQSSVPFALARILQPRIFVVTRTTSPS